jgi:transcriptional regulator of nitric oxide reductase
MWMIPADIHLVLASVFAINLFIFIYLAILQRFRLMTDLREPLILFILRYHSRPGRLFWGLP